MVYHYVLLIVIYLEGCYAPRGLYGNLRDGFGVFDPTLSITQEKVQEYFKGRGNFFSMGGSYKPSVDLKKHRCKGEPYRSSGYVISI